MDEPLRTFALFRDITPAVTREDWDAGALRSLLATGMYTDYLGYPVRWIRSFWEPGGNWGMCVYEAPGVEEIEWFNRECSFTAIDIREIQVVFSAERKGNGDLMVLEGPPAAVQFALVNSGTQPLRHFQEGKDAFAIAVIEASSFGPTTGDVAVRGIVELLPEDYV